MLASVIVVDDDDDDRLGRSAPESCVCRIRSRMCSFGSRDRTYKMPHIDVYRGDGTEQTGVNANMLDI